MRERERKKERERERKREKEKERPIMSLPVLFSITITNTIITTVTRSVSLIFKAEDLFRNFKYVYEKRYYECVRKRECSI